MKTISRFPPSLLGFAALLLAAAVATPLQAQVQAQARGPGLQVPAARSGAMPLDHAARTRQGLYLRHAEAEALDRRLRGAVVWVDTGCCAGDGADLAMLTAFGMQAALDLDNDAPFLVTGDDQRLAALVVNRLTDAGLRRVYLVTR